MEKFREIFLSTVLVWNFSHQNFSFEIAGDLYQRQPLLVNSSKGDHWGNSKVNTDNDYCMEDDDVQKSGSSNGIIRIEVPPPIREEPRFPQERWKTVFGKIFHNIA